VACAKKTLIAAFSLDDVDALIVCILPQCRIINGPFIMNKKPNGLKIR